MALVHLPDPWGGGLDGGSLQLQLSCSIPLCPTCLLGVNSSRPVKAQALMLESRNISVWRFISQFIG